MIQIFIIFFSIPLILPFIKFLPEIFSSISISRAFDSYSFYISLFLGICLVNIINKNKSIFYISVILLFIFTLETKLVAIKSWIKENTTYSKKYMSDTQICVKSFFVLILFFSNRQIMKAKELITSFASSCCFANRFHCFSAKE